MILRNWHGYPESTPKMVYQPDALRLVQTWGRRNDRTGGRYTGRGVVQPDVSTFKRKYRLKDIESEAHTTKLYEPNEDISTFK